MAAWIPLEAAYERATDQRTAVAGGTLHLYQDTLTPTGTTTKANYEDNEADFDDYAPITVATWYTPILSANGAFLLTMPQQQFQQGGTTPVTPNQIRGFYYLDSGGELMYAGRFAADIPVDVAYAGVPVELIDVYATGFSG